MTDKVNIPKRVVRKIKKSGLVKLKPSITKANNWRKTKR